MLKQRKTLAQLFEQMSPDNKTSPPIKISITKKSNFKYSKKNTFAAKEFDTLKNERKNEFDDSMRKIILKPRLKLNLLKPTEKQKIERSATARPRLFSLRKSLVLTQINLTNRKTNKINLRNFEILSFLKNKKKYFDDFRVQGKKIL